MQINKKKKVIKSFLLIGILTIMLCSLVSAFGYSSPYDEANALKIAPGGSEDIVVRIKSSPNEGDLVIKAELVNDAGIAKLIDRNLEYSVSPGLETDGIVNIRIEIPQEAVVGQEYDVNFKFSDITPSDDSGTITFTTTVSGGIKVIAEGEVVEAESMNLTWIILGIVLIIIVIAFIWFFVKNKKSAFVKPVK